MCCYLGSGQCGGHCNSNKVVVCAAICVVDNVVDIAIATR